MDLDRALTGKSAGSGGALRILRDDHDEIRRLIGEYHGAENESTHARHAIIEAVGLQAELHTRIEEDVFYPAVQDFCSDFVDEANEAHGAIEGKIDALQALDPGEPEYAEVAGQLVKALLEHIDAEESRLFPAVERAMGGELQALGRDLIRRKEELTRSVEDMEGPAT